MCWMRDAGPIPRCLQWMASKAMRDNILFSPLSSALAGCAVYAIPISACLLLFASFSRPVHFAARLPLLPPQLPLPLTPLFLQSPREFFLFDPRRINVALSRASKGLIIVGNAQALADASPTWRVSFRGRLRPCHGRVSGTIAWPVVGTNFPHSVGRISYFLAELASSPKKNESQGIFTWILRQIHLPCVRYVTSNVCYAMRCSEFPLVLAGSRSGAAAGSPLAAEESDRRPLPSTPRNILAPDPSAATGAEQCSALVSI